MRIYPKKNPGWINTYIKWELHTVPPFVSSALNLKTGNLAVLDIIMLAPENKDWIVLRMVTGRTSGFPSSYYGQNGIKHRFIHINNFNILIVPNSSTLWTNVILSLFPILLDTDLYSIWH